MDEKQKQIANKRQEIINLKSELTSSDSDIGDYKIIKIQEARLSGEKDPYDYKDLIAKREAVRNRINALQDEVKRLEAE